MTDEKVSLEDLERAAEGTPEAEPKDPAENTSEENVNTEEAPEEEIQEEPIDNKKRTKLGLKVSNLEKTMETFMEEMRANLTKPEEEEIDEIHPDDYLTVGKLDSLLEKREATRANKTEKYNSEYNSYFQAIGEDEDPDFHNKVIAELKLSHNFKRSNNGKSDAEFNYLNAKIAVLEGKEKTPLDKNKGKKNNNLGGPSESNSDIKAAKTVKVGKETQDLLNYIRSKDDSWTDEKVATVITGKPSPGLTKNR